MATAFFFNHAVTIRPSCQRSIEAGGGHINPTLGLVAELVRRGETVVYYADEAHRARVAPTGAVFRAYEGPASAPELVGSIIEMALFKLHEAVARLPAALEIVRRERPDYLMFDAMCALGWLIGRIEGLPSISSFSHFAFTPAVLQALRWPEPPTSGAGAEHLRAYEHLAADVRAKYGVEMPAIWPRVANLIGDLNLVYTSPAMHPAAETLDESFRLVGPCLRANTPAADFPYEVLDDDNIVYASLGTVFNQSVDFYRGCVEAFADGAYRLIMAIGHENDPAALGEPPAGALIRRSVPQLDVLPRARLFITHAGVNSLHEALYYGVPMVVVPQMSEQEVNARQAVANGVAVYLDRAELTAERLRGAVESVLSDPSFKRNAERIGATLHAAGGTGRAADEVLAWRAERVAGRSFADAPLPGP